MFKILLGTWALAGILTGGGLLTAVAQNPPPPPEQETTQESRPAAESQEESSAIDRQADDVPREGDTTQLEQEANREERERSQASPPPADARPDSESATDNEAPASSPDRENRNENEPASSAEAQSEQPLPGTSADTASQLGIQFRTSNSGRLMVSSVNSGREGASALREGDVIVSAGGRSFESEPALREFIMREAEQDQIPFVVMRDGRELTVTWDRKQVRDVAGTAEGANEDRRQNAVRQASIGAVIVNSRFGPRIAEIVPGSPAAEAGLLPGDYIIRLNGQPYASSSRLAADVARSSLDEAIELEIARAGQTMMIEAQPQPYEVVYERARSSQEPALAQNEQRTGGTPRMQQRLAARPDFELTQRVQELEGQVEALQQDLQQLRSRFNAVLGNETGQGADVPDNSERDAEHGGEQSPQ